VSEAVCRHLLLPDGTFDTKTMIVTPAMLPPEFRSKLEIKIKDSLPEGVLSLAAELNEPETELGENEKIFDEIKEAGLNKSCVVYFTPAGFKVRLLPNVSPPVTRLCCRGLGN
jgi:hypothetical protein